MKISRRAVSLSGMGLLAASALPARAFDLPIVDPFEGESDFWTAVEAWRGDFPERDRQEIAPVVWVIAGLAAQMLLLTVAGFSIATGLLFAFTARAFGKRKLWFSIPVGIVLSFAIWIVFAQLLQLSLPAGPLERLFF